MMTAHEAMIMALTANQTKILRAKLVAKDTIDVIEAIIKCDAQEGHDRSVFHLYNYHNFISDCEKKAYRYELTEILTTHGYTVKYNNAESFLEIRFF